VVFQTLQGLKFLLRVFDILHFLEHLQRMIKWERIAGADQFIINVISIAVKVKIIASISICAELPGYALINGAN
jgi:hypothetical protein